MYNKVVHFLTGNQLLSQYRQYLQLNIWSSNFQLIFKGELKSKNRVCFYYFIWKLWTYKIKFWQLFSKKLGLKLGFSRFLGLVIVGSLQMSAVCCDVSDGERYSICPKGATSCFTSKALLFHKYCFPS